MSDIFKDIIIFLPGIAGSVLTKNGKAVWDPAPGAVLKGIFTAGGSVRSLKMDGDDHTLDDLGDGVVATHLCQDLHILPGFYKIDGYTGLREHLLGRMPLVMGENYFEFPYDWRRDNRVSARKLSRKAEQWITKRRETYPDAKIILIGHSMGGIVSRLYLELHEGWRDTRTLFTFGTPYSGSFKALDKLCNGLFVGKWGVGVDMTDTLSSFTSVYQLLPSFKAIQHPDTGTWDYLDAPGISLPGLNPVRVKDALDMHRDLRAAVDEHLNEPDYVTGCYDTRALVGDFIDTLSSAELRSGKVVLSTYGTRGESGGDGTVPKISAVPHERLTGWRNVIWLNESHGSLQNNDVSTDNISGLLTAPTMDDVGILTAKGDKLSVAAEDAILGDDVVVTARAETPTQDLTCRIEAIGRDKTDEFDMIQDPDNPMNASLSIPKLPEGDYRVSVRGQTTNRVTDIISVLDLKA